MEADFQLQEHLRVGLPFCFMGLDGSRPLLPCSIRRRRKETSSKHKLARGLFKMADLKPSTQCKPNPTFVASVPCLRVVTSLVSSYCFLRGTAGFSSWRRFGLMSSLRHFYVFVSSGLPFVDCATYLGRYLMYVSTLLA